MTESRHNAPTTFSTKQLAEQWLQDEQRLIERGEWSPPKQRLHREVVRAQTLGAYADEWVEQRPIKESSKRDYRYQIKTHVTDVLGPIPLRALDAAAVRAWYAGLDTTQYGKFKVYNLLRSICSTAVGDGLLSPNPCQLKVKKPDRQVKPVVHEPADVAAAVNVLGQPRYTALALIALWCGLRWGELGELRRKDISDNAEIISVTRRFNHRHGCDIGPPKNGSHDVVVPPHIRAAIKHHLDVHVETDPEALLLTGKSKYGCGHLSDATFRKAWQKALKSVGLQSTRLHDMKHFSGTMTARVGATLTENMARHGHTTATSSLVYQDVVARRPAELAEALSTLAEMDDSEG